MKKFLLYLFRWQWKLVIMILAFYGMFKLTNYLKNLNEIEARACDQEKGYTCSYYEVERYIKYER